jgi:hypothetical protein
MIHQYLLPGLGGSIVAAKAYIDQQAVLNLAVDLAFHLYPGTLDTLY